MARFLFPLLALIIPIMSSCSVVLLSLGGTDYSYLGRENIYRDKLREEFGKPVQNTTYRSPREASTIPELNTSFLRDEMDVVVTEFDIYKFYGAIKTEEGAMAAFYYLLLDICTLGLMELILFPTVTIDYFAESITPKRLTVWYDSHAMIAFALIQDWETGRPIAKIIKR